MPPARSTVFKQASGDVLLLTLWDLKLLNSGRQAGRRELLGQESYRGMHRVTRVGRSG